MAQTGLLCFVIGRCLMLRYKRLTAFSNFLFKRWLKEKS